MTVESSKKIDAATPAEIVPVSDETRAMVEQSMADEPDEIKQKLGELVDAIKRRTTTEMQSAGEMTRETYIQAMDEARGRLKKTEQFFQQQERSVEETVRSLTDEATDRWETLITEVQRMGNRLDRAVNAAWKELTDPKDTPDA
jgi:DNA anti-recombination protein RmuC